MRFYQWRLQDSVAGGASGVATCTVGGANFYLAHWALNRYLAHRRRRRGAGGTCPPPRQKNGENIFVRLLICKIRPFWGKNHVKFRHFVNFSYLFFGQKYLVPLKLTELLPGLPWEFPWVWVWDGYGNCDEFPWGMWEFCGNFWVAVRLSGNALIMR